MSQARIERLEQLVHRSSTLRGELRTLRQDILFFLDYLSDRLERRPDSESLSPSNLPAWTAACEDLSQLCAEQSAQLYKESVLNRQIAEDCTQELAAMDGRLQSARGNVLETARLKRVQLTLTEERAYSKRMAQQFKALADRYNKLVIEFKLALNQLPPATHVLPAHSQLLADYQERYELLAAETQRINQQYLAEMDPGAPLPGGQ